MKGDAKVKRTGRTGTRVEMSVDRMPRPFELGAGYATYVVWAISPTGQADNLGEIKRSTLGFIDSKVTVTTPLQTFSIIVTAEPHFLVSRPSQAIMLENLNPVGENGQRIGTSAAVTYFGNSSDYFRDPRTPAIAEVDYARTPTAILQAQQAVALARYAGAERDALSELTEAETLLQNAENGWRAGRDSDSVDISARRSIAEAVRAEQVASQRREAREKRNEQARTDSEIRAAENKFVDAQDQVNDLKSELARETRNRELAERDALNFSSQLKEFRDENGRLREELGRIRVEFENERAKAAAAETERRSMQEARQKESREASIRISESDLINSLRSFGTVAKTDRGVVLTLPESWWTALRSTTLVPQADGKLTLLSEILAKNPEYRISVESHTDTAGAPDVIQSVTDRRSYAIAEKFAAYGIEEGRIVAKGLGATLPLGPNTTAASRAKNRRTQVILSLHMQ
jgi:outer membrane protein OmpA-like peptidoglycan-associated protein